MLGTARQPCANMFCPALSNNSYERSVPRQPDDQHPGEPHHPSRKGYQRDAHCLESSAHPLSTQHQTLHRRAQVERQHRYGPPCSVGSEQPRREPAHCKVTLENAMDLLALAASHALTTRSTLSPARGRFVTTGRSTLNLPLLDNAIAGKGICIRASIAGSGCSINRSLVAMNRYSGAVPGVAPSSLGTKFTSAHS